MPVPIAMTGLSDPCAVRHLEEFGKIAGVQPFHKVRAMDLDGPWTDSKGARDALVRAAVDETQQHIALAARQASKSVMKVVTILPHLFETGRQGFASVPNRFVQVVGRDWREEKINRPRAHRRDDLVTLRQCVADEDYLKIRWTGRQDAGE